MNDLRDQTQWKAINQDGEYIIKGKLGQVSLYENNELDVWICDWTNTEEDMKRSHHRRARMETFGWKAKNHYDDGGLFIRPFSDLDTACRFIKAKRKRSYSPEVLKSMVERARTMASNRKKQLQGGLISNETRENA